MVQWDEAVLTVEPVAPGAGFWIGPASRAGHRGHFVLPEGLLVARRLQLVSRQPSGEVRATLLDGASGHVELPERGRLSLAQARLELGGHDGADAASARAAQIDLPTGTELVQRLGRFTFYIAVFRTAPELGGRRRSVGLRDRGRLAKTAALSAWLHAAVAGMAFAWPAPPVDEGGMSPDDRHRIHRWLRAAELADDAAAAEERARERGVEGAEGGSGTRARGQEGSMGAPGATPDARYGVRGPTASGGPSHARAQALHGAAEFGMIGLLSSGGRGDPDAPTAPWGRDDALGSDPLNARGNAWGGAGLGASGVGHGAGTGTGQGFGSGAARAPSSAGAYGREPSLPSIAIDPNGRFATTYRPGRGHLAAFEHAVARGLVPAATRELVSDVGSRYAPAVPVPDDRALAYRLDLERKALPPGGGPVHLRIALRSSSRASGVRPRLSVHLALDTSGSMQGEPLARAKQAARQLVDRLTPRDAFSLTTFSTDAELRVKAGPVGPRKAQIQAAIDEAQATGSTNIGAALEQAYRQAIGRPADGDVERVVLLLSDGQPTAGETHPRQLAARALRAFQEGAQTSTFGLGVQYDGALMSAIAADGGGGYYYLSDAEHIGTALSTEIKRRLDPVATAVELRVRLREGVQLLRVYGSRKLAEDEAARVRAQEVAADQQAESRHRIVRDRQHDRSGGMRFFIPAFARDDRHGLLLELGVAAGTGERTVGSFEIRYKDRVHQRNVGDEQPIRIAYANSDAASARTIDPSVACTVQGHRAGEDLLVAATHIARGDHGAAAQLLSERERILHRAAQSLDEPGLRTDAQRLARLRAHASPEQGIREPRALALLLETAGRSHLR